MNAKAADPAPTPPPGVSVRPVDVDQARPLRLKFLRPGVGESGVTYKTDDETSAAPASARSAPSARWTLVRPIAGMLGTAPRLSGRSGE